jgi:hypothetical protein
MNRVKEAVWICCFSFHIFDLLVSYDIASGSFCLNPFIEDPNPIPDPIPKSSKERHTKSMHMKVRF